MSFQIRYGPFPDQKKKEEMKYDFYAKISYQMFPEMEDEFNRGDYEENYTVLLQPEEDENDVLTYKYDVELPYGDIKMQCYFTPRGKSEEDEDFKLIEMNSNQLDNLRYYIEPEPVSAEQQRLLDFQEEDENKKLEHETRMKQKALEEKKAREKYELQ